METVNVEKMFHKLNQDFPHWNTIAETFSYSQYLTSLGSLSEYSNGEKANSAYRH